MGRGRGLGGGESVGGGQPGHPNNAYLEMEGGEGGRGPRGEFSFHGSGLVLKGRAGGEGEGERGGGEEEEG